MTSLKSYEYVIAIAKHGGISQAAEALHMAQPALSRYLKKIETDLGVELFDRSTLPISLTQAGSRYIETGMRIISLERELEKQVQEIRRDKESVVRVGISPTRSPYMMPSIVSSYRHINPASRVVIQEKQSDELIRLLEHGELDLMISWLDEKTEMFSFVELFEEEILLAVPAMERYESASALDLLLTMPLISIGKGLAMWHVIREIAETIGVHMPEIECQSIETALAFVRHGVGATVVPSYIEKYGLREQNRNIRFLPLPVEKYPQWATVYKRRICLFYRKDQFLSQTERDFIDCVKKNNPME